MEEEVVAQEIDIGSLIIDTINDLCQGLFSSINKEIFPLLDKVVFINKDIATKHLERILGTDPKTRLACACKRSPHSICIVLRCKNDDKQLFGRKY